MSRPICAGTGRPWLPAASGEAIMLVVVLLVTLAVGGGMLYLARTLDDRIARKIDPIVRAAVRDASAAAERAGSEGGDKLAGRLLAVGNELGARLSVARAEREQLRDQLARIDVKLADIRDLLAKIAAADPDGREVPDGATLDGAALDGDDLDDAALSGETLDGTTVGGGILDGAALDGAALDGAALDRAALDGGEAVDDGDG